MSLYTDLFITFFKIGLFSFGGGYAMLPLIQTEVVHVHNWLTVSQFTDVVAISQITPGPLALTVATYIGFQSTQTVWGSLLATIGVSLPSIIITSILFVFINKFKDNLIIKNAFRGLKPTVIGLVLSAALLLMTRDNFIDEKSYGFFGAAFVASYFFNVNPIWIIVLSGVAGVFLYA